MKETLSAEREATQALRQAFVETLSNARNNYPQPVAQADGDDGDDEPLPTQEDFDEDHAGATARLTAAMLKRGLNAYHNNISQDLQGIRTAVAEIEWERVRQEDPKNFGRLEKLMRDHFRQSPPSPGEVRQVFYNLRGRYHSQLKELDAKERLSEPTPTPNPPTGKEPPKPKHDVLNAEEIMVIKGMRTDAKSYFQTRYGREPNFEDGYLRGLGIQE